MRFTFALLVCLCFVPDSSTAQSGIVTFFLPRAVRTGSELRDIIRTTQLDSTEPPEVTFDHIYFASLALSHGNESEASFAAAFGCLEHEYLPIELFGFHVPIKITNESDSEFKVRVAHLPKHLYHTLEDDRDKLQHFFASAWLKSSLGMDWLVSLMGEGVEAFETLLTSGGFRDPRDIHANQDGARFISQFEQKKEPPSAALTLNP
jgi:hypothetical protein